MERGSVPRLAGLVVATALLVLASALLVLAAGPSGAQTLPEDDCLTPAGLGATERETLTNRLLAPATIPDPVRLDIAGAPERYTLALETHFRGEVDGLLSNFEVLASLDASDGRVMEKDAFVVTAAAESERRILVSICLDPTPPSGALDADTYQAEVRFVDPRIPETTLRFDAWVGGAAGSGYAVVALAVGTLLLAALPAAIVLNAILTRRPWGAELRQALPWLVPLLIVGAVGYLWAVVAFPATDRYHLWAPSLGGAQEFLGFAFGKLTITVTAAIGALAAVPKWREAWGKLLAPESVAGSTRPAPVPAPGGSVTIPASPPEERVAADWDAVAGPAATPAPTPAGQAPTTATPAPASAARPAPPSAWPPPSTARAPRRPVRGMRWVPVAAGAVLFVAVVGTLFSAGDSSSPLDDETAGAEPTPTTTVPPVGVVPPPAALRGLTVGTTPGDEAVDALRDVGFVVFDYLVCSNSIDEAGLLEQVGETQSGAVVVDRDGPTALVTIVSPPEPLDVLVTDGQPCDD